MNIERQPASPLVGPPEPPPRYSPRPLPPYRHVPGLTPHPVKDPLGHLYGHAEPEASSSCRDLPASWSECGDYLFGVDLFNRAFLWEAHEAWEWVWIAAGKTTEPAGFVQGLIQISAALLRDHLGTPGGARNLVTRAWGRMGPVENRLSETEQSLYMGISIEMWKQSVEDYLTASGGPYPFLKLDF